MFPYGIQQDGIGRAIWAWIGQGGCIYLKLPLLNNEAWLVGQEDGAGEGSPEYFLAQGLQAL